MISVIIASLFCVVYWKNNALSAKLQSSAAGMKNYLSLPFLSRQ